MAAYDGRTLCALAEGDSEDPEYRPARAPKSEPRPARAMAEPQSNPRPALTQEEALAEDRARRLASEEGLTLIPAESSTGFRFVQRQAGARKLSTYRAIRKSGEKFDLGLYEFAAEAALAVARHLGPTVSHELSGLPTHCGKMSPARRSGFGMNHKPQSAQSAEPTIVDAVVVEPAARVKAGGLGGGGLATVPSSADALSPAGSAHDDDDVDVTSVGSASLIVTAASRNDVEPSTVNGKRKRSPAPAARCPATRVTSQHAVPEESVVQEDGVAYINVAISVPAGLRLGSTSVTVEWVPTP